MRLFVASEVNAAAPCNPFVVGEPCELRPLDDASYGSSATVYLADVLGRDCLVKVFRGGPACEQRARDEYRLLSELAGAASHAPMAFAFGRCELAGPGVAGGVKFVAAGNESPAVGAAGEGAAGEGAAGGANRAAGGADAASMGAGNESPAAGAAGEGADAVSFASFVRSARSSSLPAIAMERVGGVDLYGLRAALADGAGHVSSADVLEAARSLTFALLCCSVTSHADARYLTTVSHRDVSASNVRFVMHEGKILRAVLIDFGQGIESDDPSVTPAGGPERSSTPFVGAPEMFDQRSGSERSLRNSSYTDTYSVGCLLYYLRVGDWPLRAQVEGIACRLGFGIEGRQALCDLKMAAAIRLPAEFVQTDDDRKLSAIIARCTEPGVGKLEGRYDLVRLADRLGISEEEAAAARKASTVNAPQVDLGDETVDPAPLEPGELLLPGNKPQLGEVGEPGKAAGLAGPTVPTGFASEIGGPVGARAQDALGPSAEQDGLGPAGPTVPMAPASEAADHDGVSHGGRAERFRASESESGRGSHGENGADIGAHQASSGSGGDRDLASVRRQLRGGRASSSVPLVLKVVTCVLVVAAVVVAFALDVPKLLAGNASATDAQTLVFYPRSENLSASQLRETATLMQTRLSNVDGAKAAVLDSADGIAVTLPASFTDPLALKGELQDNSVTTDLAAAYLMSNTKSILANPLALYLVDASDEDAIYSGAAPRVRIYRTEIASAESCSGRVDGLEAASYLIDGASSYVRITLTDEAKSRLKEACGSWYEQAAFAFDLGGTTWSTASSVLQEDGSYAVSARFISTPDTAEMVAAALTSDEYPASFDCELVPDVTWEEPSSENAGQVAANDIADEDAWVVVAGSYDGLSEGKQLDTRSLLTARCEAMGVSYALGTVDGGAGIAVKLKAEGFDALAAKVLVAGSSITLSYGTGERSALSDNVALADVDGHAAVRVSSGLTGRVEEAAKAACEVPGTLIYAEMLDIPLMFTSTFDASTTELVFDEACSSCAAVGDENAWLPKLIVSACETGHSPATLTYAGKADLSWGGTSSLTGADAGIVSEARSAAKHANPASKVGCEDGYPTNLLVSLQADGNLDADADADADAIAATALAEARAAYEEMDFETGPFTKLSFYYGDARVNPAVEIVFKKNRTVVSSDEFSVEVEFAVSGSADGRDALLASLNAAAAADEFYAGKTSA